MEANMFDMGNLQELMKQSAETANAGHTAAEAQVVAMNNLASSINCLAVAMLEVAKSHV